MDITTILSTELRLLEPICTFIQRDDGLVYRSVLFPKYYGGNGIALRASCGRTLAEWEAIFHEYFDPGIHEHVTFTFPREEQFEGLIADARNAGYHVTFESYMFVDRTDRCAPVPEGFGVRRTRTEDDWRRLAEFSRQSDADADWFDPAYIGPDRLFEKTRRTSEAIGIEWLVLTADGSDEILAGLGIFRHAGICRLQQVETALGHRRKGYASVLVGYAVRYAIETLATTGVALCADADYYAVDLYRKLGFVPCGDMVVLMWYPIRNPAFLKENT